MANNNPFQAPKTPVENYYYNMSFEKYAALFSIIHSKLKIMSEGKMVQIPLLPLSGRRFKTKNKTAQNQLPMATFLLSGDCEVDKSSTKSRNLKVKTDTGILKNGIPVIIPVEYNVRCKNRTQIWQIIEQLYGAFYPSADCRIKDNDSLLQDQNVKIKILSHQVLDNYEGDGTELECVDATFNFEIHGNIYGYPFWTKKNDDDGTEEGKVKGVIEEVVVELSTDLKKEWFELEHWFTVDKDGTHGGTIYE